MVNEDEGGDPIVPTQEGTFFSCKKMIRSRGRKCRKGPWPRREMSVDIITKEEASVTSNHVKEGKKAHRFGIFAKMPETKVTSKDTKMLFEVFLIRRAKESNKAFCSTFLISIA